jgi:subtilisin
MPNHVRAVVRVLGVGILVSTAPFPLLRAQAPDRVNVLITFRDLPGSADGESVRGVGGQIKFIFHLVPAIAASIPQQAVTALLRNPRVSAVQPDARIFALDVELDNSWGVKRIGAGLVHSATPLYKGAGVKVAILDTGIDYNHPDLAQSFDPSLRGKDFVNGDDDPMDDHLHGTHVAGSIAARDDDVGVVGVAPEVTLYALKVLDKYGTGSFSSIIAALEWAKDHGIHVANHSYGSISDPDAGSGATLIKDAFAAAETAGIVSVAAAGNNGDCAGTGDNVGYPARYASVIAVAATFQTDESLCFSSTGPDVEIAAPGYEINSTLPGGGYGVLSGTSMASPHVAGTAALLINAGVVDSSVEGSPGHGRVNDEVRRILNCTALDRGRVGRDTWYGFGLVQAAAAVAATGSSLECVNVSVTTDQPSYTMTSESAQLTVVVTDQNDAAVSGLSSSAFTTIIDNTPASVTFSETSTFGTYSGSLGLVGSAEGVHNVGVKIATDSISGGGATSFNVVNVTVVNVSSIAHSVWGGPKSNRNLRSTIALNYGADGSGAGVGGASVSVRLSRNGSPYSSGTATTNSSGIATFDAMNAPQGCYHIDVLAVSASSGNWDGLTPSNVYCKSK